MDGHTYYCNTPLLLQSALVNDVTTIRLPSRRAHTLQNLDKCFWGLESGLSKKKSQLVKSLDIAWRASLDLRGIKMLVML